MLRAQEYKSDLPPAWFIDPRPAIVSRAFFVLQLYLHQISITQFGVPTNGKEKKSIEGIAGAIANDEEEGANQEGDEKEVDQESQCRTDTAISNGRRQTDRRQTASERNEARRRLVG